MASHCVFHCPHCNSMNTNDPDTTGVWLDDYEPTRCFDCEWNDLRCWNCLGRNFYDGHDDDFLALPGQIVCVNCAAIQ